MAKGKKRVSGKPPEIKDNRKISSDANADDFSLEAQSVPADALKPKPKQGDLRLNAGAAPRAMRGGAKEEARVLSYRHQDKRKNNPQVGLVNEANDPQQPKTEWRYDPHIDPALQFDVGRAGKANNGVRLG
jgi:adenine-specific DNA-methyltransferase